MKKFFDRLRRWLIKKLGGYTEQFPPIQPKRIRQVDVQTQKLQAQISIPAPPTSEIDFEKYCKKCVFERLAQHLEESPYIQWESAYNIFEQKMDVRATLYLVNAEYMDPRLGGWVE